jgi:uncharacterized protein
MTGTSPKFLKAIPLILILLTELACPAFSGDIQALIKNAEDGNPKAQFNLGVAYAKGEGVPQDYAESIKWYRLAADQGLAEAQNNLGIAYDRGQGVPKDDAESMKWFRMAAEQGLADAQYNLGVAYYNGQGVPQDYAESMKWFRMAAEQGHAGAQCILGISYSDGHVVPQDYLLAYFWTSLASKSSTCGGDNSRVNYFYMDYAANAARQLTPDQLMKVQQMIRDWVEKHPRE